MHKYSFVMVVVSGWRLWEVMVLSMLMWYHFILAVYKYLSVDTVPLCFSGTC
jgi:hypothetical protein